MHFIFYLRCLCPNFYLKRYIDVHVCSVMSDSLQSHVAHQALLSMEFSRQKYWSGLPFPPPGDLSHPGIEPTSPGSHALQVDSLSMSHQGSPMG